MLAKREVKITKVILELTSTEVSQLLALAECYQEEVKSCRIAGWPAVKGIDSELIAILREQVKLHQVEAT